MPAASGVHVAPTAATAAFLGRRLGFLAANLPAVFGAYRRQANIAYGSDPQQRLDVYMTQYAQRRRLVR